MTTYYNEIDPYAAQWLRNLIDAGYIAAGVVDTRSITEVQPDDLKGFTQCHFFAGIGVWSYALRLAGWDDSRPVWTGSCPCQPFSAAGKGTGFNDERHLWPELHRLIRQCRPPVVFGEQVASKDGLEWLDAVQADLEASGYASAAVDMCAAGIGAPHIRQRLWWVGYSIDQGLEGYTGNGNGTPGWTEPAGSIAEAGEPSRMAQDPISIGRRGGGDGDTSGNHGQVQVEGLGAYGDTGPTNGFWRDADWLFCRDAKWRAVEPGTFPLAYGASSRVGRLRAYGNAIVPQVAEQVIRTYMEWQQ
jgi:DNA (cytosine-5)-methyltransferase 1